MAGKELLRILLIDDDKDLLDLLKYNFEKEGFLVRTVSKIRKAILTAKKFQPHLIVLDVVMPEGNGIDLCREFRRHTCFKSVYIFFLTARSESYYREAAWDIGADDFIEKLSGIRGLTNKVTAVLKNHLIIKKSIASVSVDELLINKRSGVVRFRNQEISLSEPEFEILFFLMQNPNTVVSLKSLIRVIWGSEIYVRASSVQNYIEKLQHKVGSKLIEIVGHDEYRLNQRIR